MRKILGVLVVLLCAVTVKAQDIDAIIKRYSDREYELLIPDLKALDTVFYAANSWKIDYMLASCYCKTEEFKTGAEVFVWMKDEYDLSDELRDLLTEKSKQCTFQNLVADLVAQNSGTNSTSGFSGVSSKEIRLDAIDEDGAQSLRASVKSNRKEIDFSERILTIGEEVKLKKEVRKRPVLKRAVKTDHLLVFGTMEKASLSRLAEELEKSLSFFSSEFDLKIPEDYIQVNVFESKDDLRTFADEYHQILLAESTFGYTFDDDLSISGFIPPHLYAGTLQHELFHLITHFNLKKMPFWLEEGMAALYEGSEFSGDKLLGYDNWRGKVLRTYGAKYLNSGNFSVVGLMNDFNWTSLQEASKEEQGENIAYLAIFRYMFIYMQNEGYLKDFFAKVRTKRTFDRDGFYEAAISEVTGKTPDEFQEGFLAWLKAELKF